MIALVAARSSVWNDSWLILSKRKTAEQISRVANALRSFRSHSAPVDGKRNQ
jgi:hypothetical protein